jgi:hypothetical protein
MFALPVTSKRSQSPSGGATYGNAELSASYSGQRFEINEQLLAQTSQVRKRMDTGGDR